MEETYKKSKGSAGQKGVQFQLDLITVCLLNALHNHKNWKISSENPIAGKYDDIVVELAGEAAVLIQAKHKDNRNITKDQLLSENYKNSDFSLPKYFFSYEEIKRKFSERTVIICTNTAINTKGLEDMLTPRQAQPDSLLYHESDCSFYKFNENILPDLKKSAETYLSNNSRDKSTGKAVITKENIKDFLENLQIFSCYPCEDYLHKIIDRSLTRLSCSSLCRNISSQEILRKVEYWFQQPKGEYLTEARGKAMLCEIRSDKYCESLKDFNVSFASNDLDIAGSEKIIHVKTTEEHLLQMIKIYCALLGSNTRKLYVNPDDAVEVQKNVVEAFGLSRYIFLIMAWDAIKDKIAKKEIIGKLKEVLEKNQYKKVILVANTDVKLSQQFGLTDIHRVDGSVKFPELSKESQEILLKRNNVTFQGKRVTLGELLHTEATEDCTKSLNGTMLEELVRGKEIKVGVRSLDLDEDTARYYVTRRFTTTVYDIPWETYIFTEENLFNAREKIIVISESAGMGKSTVLTKIAVTITETYSSFWVIKVNLYDYSRVLRDFVKTRRNKITAAELLNSLEATKMTNEFEKIVFSIGGKVILMLDGVDEISPDYTDLVLSLLRHCQEAANFKKIFVTTRPHVDLKLNEATLFQMLPFTILEQINFLTGYWLHNLHLTGEDKAKCKQYAAILIRKISSWTISSQYWQNTFTDIPLQIKMLAEIFQENITGQGSGDWEGCKEYLLRGKSEPKLPEKFNIAELYDTFIEKKRDVFIDKGSGGSVTATPALLNQFKLCLAYHRSLAVHTILPEYQQVFKATIPEDSDTEEYILKIGIVQRLGGRINFIHRTFAEYFVAHSIVQELKLQNPDANFQRLLINTILWGDEFKIVRTFLDILLQRVPLPLNIFKQYRSMKYEESNSSLIFELVREGHVAILRLILESVRFKVIESRSVNVKVWRLKIPFRKRNTLNDLAVLVREAGVNIKREDGQTPLHLAVKEDHLEMVDFLAQQGANINARDARGEAAVHIAASRGASDIVACLVKHGLDINLKNSDNDTALHLATYRKNWNIVKYLVEHGADVHAKGYGGVTALHVAIIQNEPDIVEYHMEHASTINKKHSKDSTVVHRATYDENRNVVKYLVEQGADVNAGDEEGLTALHVAAKFSKMDIIADILECGADINKKNNEKNTALHVAIHGGNWNIVKYLVEHGADVNVEDGRKLTALHLAAKLNKIEIVGSLLKHGAHINKKNNQNNTALHVAIFGENWNVVKYLVEHGAAVDIKDHLGYSPLHHALKPDTLDIAECLVENGADLNAGDEEGSTALYMAAKLNRIDMVEYLLEHGGYVNQKNNKNNTALHAAFYGKKWDVVKCLVEHGADVDIKDNLGYSALHLAVSLDVLDIVACLIENGADVNARDEGGSTALYLAAKFNKIDMVEYLLEQGADINMKNDEHETALHAAVSNENWNIVVYLVEHDADINAGDYSGLIALHVAVKFNETDRVKYLLEHGVDVNMKNCKNNTALHIATFEKNWSIVNCLVKCGADVNAQGQKGLTALHIAVMVNKIEFVEYFLKHGADIRMKNNNNNTALQVATFEENWNIVNCFVNKTAYLIGLHDYE